MNEQSAVRRGETRVDAEVLRNALRAGGAGRTRNDVVAVRVGLKRGAVVRAGDGLVARQAFQCETSGPGVFIAPARELVHALDALKGELQIAFETAGDRGRVRVHQGAICLLEHSVRDSRLSRAYEDDRKMPSGPSVAAGPLGFALRQARDFVAPDCVRQPEHRVVYVGPVPGAEHPVVLARDEHGLLLCVLEGFGPAVMTVPLAHLAAVIGFLASRNAVTASAIGPWFTLADEAGSALAWHCATVARLARLPPPWATVSTDRESLVAAIDRLAPRADAAAEVIIARRGNQLVLGDTDDRTTEVVTVLDAAPVASARATMRATRLRVACDTASRQLRLHISPRCVLTIERAIINRRGRQVQREAEGSVCVQTFRLVAAMAGIHDVAPAGAEAPASQPAKDGASE